MAKRRSDEIKNGPAKDKVYDLQAGLLYWQKRLRLQDWDIDATWVPNFDDRGSNMVVGRLKSSSISINAQLREQPVDAEETLVHELLHIPFDFLDARDPNGLCAVEEMLLEQAIESMAKTLVRLRHG